MKCNKLKMEDKISFPLFAHHRYCICFSWDPHVVRLKSLFSFLIPTVNFKTYYVEQQMIINLYLKNLMDKTACEGRYYLILKKE